MFSFEIKSMTLSFSSCVAIHIFIQTGRDLFRCQEVLFTSISSFVALTVWKDHELVNDLSCICLSVFRVWFKTVYLLLLSGPRKNKKVHFFVAFSLRWHGICSKV